MLDRPMRSNQRQPLCRRPGVGCRNGPEHLDAVLGRGLGGATGRLSLCATARLGTLPPCPHVTAAGASSRNETRALISATLSPCEGDSYGAVRQSRMTKLGDASTPDERHAICGARVGTDSGLTQGLCRAPVRREPEPVAEAASHPGRDQGCVGRLCLLAGTPQGSRRSRTDPRRMRLLLPSWPAPCAGVASLGAQLTRVSGSNSGRRSSSLSYSHHR
jgi:hypothetical protein